MQSSALALSPSSTPLLRPLNKSTNSRFCSTLGIPSLKPADPGFIHGVSCLQISHFSTFERFSTRIPSNRRYSNIKVRAALVPDNVDETQKSSAVIRTLQLGGMFAVWYLLNIYFNIFNKQVHHLYTYLAVPFR